MSTPIAFTFDAAKAVDLLLREPAGFELADASVTGCPCSPEGRPTNCRVTAEGVACRCGRLVARWTGAPGVSDLEPVDAPPTA